MLGFGFKTYVSYRMRRRRQKEVQKVNEYYYEFLREALPPGPVREEAFNPHPTSPCIEDRISDSTGSGHSGPGHSTSNGVVPLGSSSSGGVLANHHPSISLGNSSSGSIGSGGGAGGSSLSSSGSPGGSIGGSNGNVNSISTNHGSPVMGGWQKH